MARRRSVSITRKRTDRVSLEWVGFRSGGSQGNLNTTVIHEIIGPAAASTIVQTDLTVLRVVGVISIAAQNTVAATTSIGMMLRVANVGGDQVINESVSPLSTDVDDFDNSGIMWWRTISRAGAGVAAADLDTIAFHIPFDIKVKRKMDKRDTLILELEAGSTAVARASVDLRCLIRTY